MRRLDHIVVGCETLEAGAQWLVEKLGQAPDRGGEHPLMGTHNRLLSLGPGLYLELIAIDPAAKPPKRPRWYALDSFTGPPRVVTWVARDSAFVAPQGTSMAEITRGGLRAQFSLPDGAHMPGEGTRPLLIRWEGGVHPCDSLPDRGFRLRRLQLFSPDTGGRLIGDPRIRLDYGPTELRALIVTPDETEVWL